MSVYFQIEEYHRPQNLAQAVDILSRSGNCARVIAGGTDILPLRPGAKKIDPVNDLVIFPSWVWIISKKMVTTSVSVRPPQLTPWGHHLYFYQFPIRHCRRRPTLTPPQPSETGQPWEAICAQHLPTGILPYRCWYWMLSWWRPDLKAKGISRLKAFLKVPIIRP